MMPPGSSEQEGLQDMAGPMNAPPRFRDELMFVRDTDGTPISADATILALSEPAPPAELPPPATEPMAAPAFPQEPPTSLPDDPPAAPSYPEFSMFSPYPEASTDFREVAPLPPEPAPPPEPPRFDATARIAAEADATAAALENLERLLEQQKRPYLHAVAPAYQPDPFRERAVPPPAQVDSLRLRMQRIEPEPPSFPRHPGQAPLLPLPMPRPRRRRSVFLVGFLTGLALSLMAGAVLLFFILHVGAG